MSTIEVSQGNTIGDLILNSCGDISAWSDFLNENNFNDWTPQLYNGQILDIPINTDTNLGNILDLQKYPANNFSITNVYEQIDAIFLVLANAPPKTAPVIQPTIIETNSYYPTPPLATIGDVILNPTGDIANWSDILDTNNFDTWTPDLYAGQIITIPNTASINLNNFRGLNTYPANNFSVPDIYNQINAIFGLLNNPVEDWILAINRGFWEDIGYWRDGAVWIDAP